MANAKELKAIENKKRNNSIEISGIPPPPNHVVSVLIKNNKEIKKLKKPKP